MSKFTGVLTRTGAALIANAVALGTRLEITHIAVGDGGGTLPYPDAAQTALVNEKKRGPINSASIDPAEPSVIILKQVIPPQEGGFWIREVGAFDKDGNLIAVANTPETYKAALSEGSGGEMVIRMDVLVSDTSAVTLKVEPSTVLATREYVDEKIREYEQTHTLPEATLEKKGIAQLSNETNSDSEQLAATPKAVKIAMDNADKRLRKDQNGADIPDKARFRREIGLGKLATQDSVQSASTTKAGVVQLNSSVNSSSDEQAATPVAVKKAYDLANKALPKSGGTIDGQLTVNGLATFKRRITCESSLDVASFVDIGQSRFADNGDIRGSAWGGGWLSSKISALNYTLAGAGMGAMVKVPMVQDIYNVPAGGVMVGLGLRGGGVTDIYYRPLMVRSASTGWVVVGYV